MKRYLIQKEINGRFYNITSFESMKDAELVIRLCKSNEYRILDRTKRKYLLRKENKK